MFVNVLRHGLSFLMYNMKSEKQSGSVALAKINEMVYKWSIPLLFTTGEVLETRVIFPFGKKSNAVQAKNTVVELALKHR